MERIGSTYFFCQTVESLSICWNVCNRRRAREIQVGERARRSRGFVAVVVVDLVFLKLDTARGGTLAALHTQLPYSNNVSQSYAKHDGARA